MNTHSLALVPKVLAALMYNYGQNVEEDPHNPFKGKAGLHVGLEATPEVLFCDYSGAAFKPKLT